MNKRFFVYLYFLFLFCGFGRFSCATQAVNNCVPQKSIQALKNEIMYELDAKSQKLKCDIEHFEGDVALFESISDDQACQQAKSELKTAKRELAAVQKKMHKLAHVFNKRPPGALFDWRKTLFYSINATFILGAGFVAYKVFQKINSNSNLGERQKAFMLAGAVVGVLLLIQFLLCYFSENIAIAAVDAEKLDPEKYAHVYKIVEELCKKANIPVTSLFMMDENMPNAFATGPWPSSSTIVVSKGLLDLLDENELGSVLSHELSHIKNYDVLIDTLFFVLSIPLMFLSDTVKHSHDKSKSDICNDDVSIDEVSNFILFRLIGWGMKCALRLSRLFVSRSVEYRADQEGAALSENPLALASALDKMRKRVKSSFFGGKAAKSGSNLIESYFELFSTHPLDKKRIERLKTLDCFYREKMAKLLDK
ncbi:MAG: Protease HtpX-like protein [candidate division TM6 bacterium GW2011_GWF2_37_49]|nr:MAG: Protease HtpX-like protein [candidate division TM6 bacterium GW2011_GWF2_37_49]